MLNRIVTFSSPRTFSDRDFRVQSPFARVVRVPMGIGEGFKLRLNGLGANFWEKVVTKIAWGKGASIGTCMLNVMPYAQAVAFKNELGAM